MTDMDRVDCELAKIYYREGRDGLDIAEMWISSIIGALIEVQNARATNPAACPTFGPEATPHVAARRIIARLLDAGWRPADPDCLTKADSITEPKETPVRLYSAAYLAYGVQIPDTDSDRLEDTLHDLDNGVGYLCVGRFEDQRTYLTTECFSADAGEYRIFAPETLNDRPERASWDAALKTAAEALGYTGPLLPAWFITADLDN